MSSETSKRAVRWAPFRHLTVGQALREATRLLRQGGIESPRLDAEVLLSHLLGCERTGLYVRDHEPLAPSVAEALTDFVARRLAHEPVAYLLGERAFYDLTLVVTPAVLVPRPETEHLVEEALAWARGREDDPLRVVDVGTGSGALAIALARQLVAAQVWAIDVSAEALAVAASNIARYDLHERVTLLRGDLLEPLPAGGLDLIVANLPYVPNPEMPHLMPDVRDYEPHLALDGGPDGTDLIARLLPQAAARLRTPGLLLLEIDPSQDRALARLARETWPDADVSVGHDLAGLARWVRVARGQEHGESDECP